MPQPFTVNIPEDALVDLQARLARTRWPDEKVGSGWQYGTSLAYLQELVGYWQDRYDWRAHEARMNELPQFTVPIAGIDLHFVHLRGAGPNPLPVLLPHGWPGTFWEFHKLIPLLTDSARFGGDPADAFTVVVPSQPGYAFSYRPNQPRLNVVEIADLYVELMTEVLGYERFLVQAGDWGALVAARLAYAHPEKVTALHLNVVSLRRDPNRQPGDGTPEEEQYFASLQDWFREESAYWAIQGTKPQTLAYGLTDSPVGLAAWIVEKYRSWSDCGGEIERRFSKDELLTTIMLYWLTGAVNTSFWPYYSRNHEPWPIPDGAYIQTPTAHASFPGELLHPPRSLAERTYNIKRWTNMPAGGHFAALEEPVLLAEDMRQFFRQFRT
jgi:pimeloyl-ACP methyl ester carboxylesterase